MLVNLISPPFIRVEKYNNIDTPTLMFAIVTKREVGMPQLFVDFVYISCLGVYMTTLIN